MKIGEWIPEPEPRSFGLDTGWWLVQYVDMRDEDGTPARVCLGMGMTEELARTLAQRLNG